MTEKQKTCLTEKEIKEIYHTVLESDTENLVAEAISLTEQAIMKKAVPKSEFEAILKEGADYALRLNDANKAYDKLKEEFTYKLMQKSFETKESWMNDVYKWVTTPKDKRKPANISFTAGHERNICYTFEHLEYELENSIPKEKVRKVTNRCRELFSGLEENVVIEYIEKQLLGEK